MTATSTPAITARKIHPPSVSVIAGPCSVLWARRVPGLSGAGSALADDLRRERLQRLPVVRPLAERDVEARAAERPELLHHRARVLHAAAQIARARGAVVGASAEVALELRLCALHALRVGAEVEAEVHRAHDRLRVAAFLLAPLVEHGALVLPVLGPDVGAVPAVGELRDRKST